MRENMQSKAKTAAQYLAELTPERREAISTVRKVILKNLPKGYEESMQYGMISYIIPLTRYPKTYNGQALGIAALASQKNYMALYLMNIYGDKKTEDWFRKRFRESGRKPDMGKSCIRFKKLDDLPLVVIGEAIARTSVEDFIALYEKSRKPKLFRQ
jgi:hypothetical protein